MKSLQILFNLAFISLVIIISSPVYADSIKKIKIASYIGVEVGGDIRQFEETLAYSRNQTRKMYIEEVVDAAAKLSGGHFDPTGMLGTLQKIQETADSKRDINKAIDSIKIGFSIGEFFKSEIEELHRLNGIPASEQRINFVNTFPIINSHMMYNAKAQYEYYVFIQMAHVGGGQFRMSATLGSIHDGTEKTYSGFGYLENALAQVAEGIFRSIMEIDRPAWKNPNEALTWIPGPRNISSLGAKEAHLFCAGQNARLPLADELIQAQHGSAYKNGGIDSFQIGEKYFIGDQLRQAGLIYIIAIQNSGSQRIPTIQIVAGQAGKVWCVKGAMSERNALILKIYSIGRKLNPKGISIMHFPERVPVKSLPAIKALESLLIHLNAAGAELDVSLKHSDLMSSDEALNELSKAGIGLTISSAIL